MQYLSLFFQGRILIYQFIHKLVELFLMKLIIYSLSSFIDSKQACYKTYDCNGNFNRSHFEVRYSIYFAYKVTNIQRNKRDKLLQKYFAVIDAEDAEDAVV